MQIRAQYAGLFDFLLVRVEFVDHEFTGRLDDHLLFIVERKIHDESSCYPLAHCRSKLSCRPSCSTWMPAGQSRGLVTALAVKPFMNVTTERST